MANLGTDFAIQTLATDDAVFAQWNYTYSLTLGKDAPIGQVVFGTAPRLTTTFPNFGKTTFPRAT